MKLYESLVNALNEADNTKTELTYDVGFQAKKNLKNEVVKTTYLNLSGLHNIDKTTLVTSFKAVPKKESGAVFYSMTNDGAFTNSPIFQKIYNYLQGTGRYIMPDFEIMKAEIAQGKFDLLDGAKINEQNKNFEDLFEKLIKTLNDPNTQELLQKISAIGFDINEKVYGKVRSAGNAMKTYSVKPDATFVATRKNFRKLYNRILKPDATPIYLSVPAVTGKDNKKAEEELGVKYNDIKDNPHKLDSFRIHSTTGLNGFTICVFFDISDTILIPGKQDTFNGQAGLADNLKGKLNQFAVDEIGDKKIDIEGLDLKSDEGKNKALFDRFLTYFNKNKGLIPETEVYKLSKMDPTKDATAVYALRLFYSEAFSREHNDSVRNAKIYAGIATTLTVENMADVERLKIIALHQDNVKNILTQRKDFVSISIPVMNVSKILRPINESAMNEQNVSPEMIMSIFDVDPNELQDNKTDNKTDNINPTEECDTPEKKQIKENFFRILNNISKI